MTDNVNHPSHYESNGPFECIELTRQYGFCVGNAIKYVWRHMDKGNPFEDLSKALWYLSYEIDYIGDTIISENYPRADKPIIELEEMNFLDMKDFWEALEYRDMAAMRTAVKHRVDKLAALYGVPKEPITCHGHVRAWRQGERLASLRKHSMTPLIVGEAMRQRGFDWDNGTIRRIEQGERRIHLDEAIALLETYGYTQANMFTAINFILKESVNNE